MGYSSRDRKELDTTECTHIYTGDTREKLKPFVVREGSQLSWGSRNVGHSGLPMEGLSFARPRAVALKWTRRNVTSATHSAA